MARKSKAQRNAEIHALALQQFEDSFDATRKAREDALMCRRFVNIRGAQWDWDEKQDFRNKMRLEIDLVSNAVNKIRNEYRRNRIEATFIPKDGIDSDALVDAAASRYRADTCDARGREARATAFDSAVEGGIGGLRLRTEYETGEDLRACLEPVSDAESSLFFDVNAKRKDKSDAMHAFHITPWSRRAFEAEFGEDAASWPRELEGQFKFPWFGPDLVYVCEYFVKEERTETYRRFEGFGGEVQEFLADEVDDEQIEVLTATGFAEVDPREEKIHRVMKYVMSGASILRDGEEIAGKCIPLVPVYGNWTILDGKEMFYGRVLKSIDPQITYNIEVSQVAATAASSGIEKPIFLDEQINPYLNEWQNDHVDNLAALRIAPIRDAQGQIVPSGPVGYTKAPNVAPAVAALIALTKQDISDQMGNPERGETVQPEVSGIAMDLIQGQLDMHSYGYLSNMAEAERRLAEIWQSIAADIYTREGREIKTVSADGQRGMAVIGKKALNVKTGKVEDQVNFARAPHDIDVEIGPTSASRRSAVVRTVTGLMQQAVDPETQSILMHVAIMNMEGEGLAAIRDWSRKKLVAMGVEKPTPEEAKEMAAAAGQPQEPDPQAVLAQSLAQEAQAKAAKAVADTGLAEARTKQAEADAAKTLAGIPLAQQDQALKTAEAIAKEMRPDVGPTNPA